MSARRRSAAAKAQLGTALLFAALGDEVRLALVVKLSTSGPLSIVTLTDGAGVTRQAVTKHLQVLAAAGLVRDYWVGRERVWEIEEEALGAARRSLETLSAQWDESLGRLKALVE